MTHVRIWIVSGHPLFVFASSEPVEADSIHITPATVIDAEIDGDMMGADAVRSAMTITNGVLSVAGRNVLNQSTSTR